jgi:hypothetical protein
MRRTLLILALTAGSLRAEVQFSGYFLTPAESLFTLSETDGETSAWLPLGASFHSYTIKSFDRQAEVITVEKDGQLVQLHLRDSKVKEKRTIITGKITVWPGPQEESFQASFYPGEEQVFPIKEGVTLHLKAKMQPDGNLLYRSRLVTRNKDGTESSEDWPFVISTPRGEFSMRIGDLGFSFKP